MLHTILKDLRIASKYTQQDLAQMLNVSKQCISMYEKGNRTPNYDLLKKYSEIFNVDYNYLLGINVSDQKEQKVRLPIDQTLSEEKKLLLDLFDQVPEEQREMVLNMIKAALGKNK